MEDMQGSLQAFKAKRREAKRATPIQGELDRLVEMYKAINSGAVGFEREFSIHWGNLSGEKRSKLVNRLLQVGLLPKEVGRALGVFNGKIVSLV